MTVPTFNDIYTITHAIQTNIEKNENFNIPAAEGKAKELCEKALQMTRAGFSSDGREGVHRPLAYEAIQILNLEHIRDYDLLQRHLSAAATYFSELSLFNCQMQKRNVDSKIRQEFLETLDRRIDITDETQVDTQFRSQVSTNFHLKCCKAAIWWMEPGKGLFTEMAKTHAANFLKGTASSIASLSPAGLIAPLIDLNVALFKERGTSWYSIVYKMKTLFYQVKRIEHLDVEAVKEVVREYRDKDKYALCLTEMFMNIIRDENMPIDLRKRLFNGGNEEFPDLCILSELQMPRKTLRKVRYLAAENLIELSKSDIFGKESIIKLAERTTKEVNDFVHNLLIFTYYYDTSSENKAIWKEELRKEPAEDPVSLRARIRDRTENGIKEIRSRAEDCKKRVRVLKSKRHVSGDEAAYATGPTEKELRTINDQIEEAELEQQNLERKEKKLEKQNQAIDQIVSNTSDLLKQIQQESPGTGPDGKG